MPKTIANLPGEEAETFAGTTTGNGTPIRVGKGERFTISADITSDSGAGTVDMERRLRGEAAFVVVEQYTVNTEKDGIAAEDQELRLSVSLHGGSGDIRIRLGG